MMRGPGGWSLLWQVGAQCLAARSRYMVGVLSTSSAQAPGVGEGRQRISDARFRRVLGAPSARYESGSETRSIVARGIPQQAALPCQAVAGGFLWALTLFVGAAALVADHFAVAGGGEERRAITSSEHRKIGQAMETTICFLSEMIQKGGPAATAGKAGIFRNHLRVVNPGRAP